MERNLRGVAGKDKRELFSERHVSRESFSNNILCF